MTGDLRLFGPPRRRTSRARGRTLRIELTRNSAVLHGTHLVGLLDGAQLARQWSPVHRTWMCARSRAHDLAAYAEHAEGRIVTVTAADR